MTPRLLLLVVKSPMTLRIVSFPSTKQIFADDPVGDGDSDSEGSGSFDGDDDEEGEDWDELEAKAKRGKLLGSAFCQHRS